MCDHLSVREEREREREQHETKGGKQTEMMRDRRGDIKRFGEGAVVDKKQT